MSAVEEIISHASRLTESERAHIASAMIATLPQDSEYDVSDEEVQERKRQLESGEDVEISLDELRAGLDL